MRKLKKAVIDRFEDEKTAVLLIEDESKEFYYPVSNLHQGLQAGDWIRIEIEGDLIVSIEIDMKETTERKKRISEKLNKLRNREDKNN